MTELKSCPFCGGEAKSNICNVRAGYHTSRVTCKKCGAKVLRGDLIAATMWNTRFDPSDALIAENKRLRKAVIAIKNLYENEKDTPFYYAGYLCIEALAEGGE